MEPAAYGCMWHTAHGWTWHMAALPFLTSQLNLMAGQGLLEPEAFGRGIA